MDSNPNEQPANFRICDLSDSDKPREKAMRHGIESLTDAELLAIVFGSGLPGQSVVSLSQAILNDNENRLSRLSRMTIPQLTARYKGIGPAKALSLAAAIELGLRCQADLQKLDPQITGSESVYNLMRHRLIKLTYEQFWVLHLSRANKVIATECISRGGTAATVVDIKMLMKSAINTLSSGMILVHNHPSGTLVPSPNDNQLTLKVKQACQLLDIRLLDHVIISPNGYYSYNDNGAI